MGQINKSVIRMGLMIAGLLIILNLKGQDLNKHKWKNRILIIQTSSESNTKYQSQVDEFRNLDEEFKERKLIVYTLIGDKYRMTDYQEKKNNVSWTLSKKMHEHTLDQKDTFKIILIGLDGGIKIEKTEILKEIELYKIIDSMPMRSAELRDKN